MNRAMLFSLMESATTLRANSRLLESQLLEITGNAVAAQGGKVNQILFGAGHASPKALRRAAANSGADLDKIAEPARVRNARKRLAQGGSKNPDAAKKIADDARGDKALADHTPVTARERIKSLVGDTKPGEPLGGKMGAHAEKMKDGGKANYGKSKKAGGIKGNQGPATSVANSKGAKHVTKGLASYAEGNHKEALSHFWNAAKSGATHPAVAAALGVGAGHFLTHAAASRAAHATIAKYAIPAIAGGAAVGYLANNRD